MKDSVRLAVYVAHGYLRLRDDVLPGAAYQRVGGDTKQEKQFGKETQTTSNASKLIHANTHMCTHRHKQTVGLHYEGFKEGYHRDKKVEFRTTRTTYSYISLLDIYECAARERTATFCHGSILLSEFGAGRTCSWPGWPVICGVGAAAGMLCAVCLLWCAEGAGVAGAETVCQK